MARLLGPRNRTRSGPPGARMWALCEAHGHRLLVGQEGADALSICT